MEINFLVFRYLSTGNIYHIIITNTKSNIFYILNLLIKNACLWFLTVQSPLRCWVGRCPHEDMDMVFLVHLQLPVKLHPDTRHVHLYTLCLVTQCYRAETKLITLLHRYQCPRPTVCARPDGIPTATKSQCQWSHLAL